MSQLNENVTFGKTGWNEYLSLDKKSIAKAALFHLSTSEKQILSKLMFTYIS